MVQWLRILEASNAGEADSTPGWGTKIPLAKGPLSQHTQWKDPECCNWDSTQPKKKSQSSPQNQTLKLSVPLLNSTEEPWPRNKKQMRGKHGCIPLDLHHEKLCPLTLVSSKARARTSSGHPSASSLKCNLRVTFNLPLPLSKSHKVTTTAVKLVAASPQATPALIWKLWAILLLSKAKKKSVFLRNNSCTYLLSHYESFLANSSNKQKRM